MAAIIFVFGVVFLVMRGVPFGKSLVAGALCGLLMGAYFYVGVRRPATFLRPLSMGWFRTAGYLWLMLLAVVPLVYAGMTDEGHSPVAVVGTTFCAFAVLTPALVWGVRRKWRRMPLCKGCGAQAHREHCQLCGTAHGTPHGP